MHAELALGAELHDALAAACARHGALRGMALLVGALDQARLCPAPDADAWALTGPLYLVHGTATITPGGITVYGVVSWEDQGMPRQAAGQILAAVTAGVTATLLAAEADDEDDEDGGDDDEADEDDDGDVGHRRARGPSQIATSPARPAAAPRPASATPTRPARPAAPVTRAEVARPEAPRPEARRPEASAPRGAEPTTRAETPAPRPGGGWAAAVAASSRTPSPRESRGRDASPDELGFDELPALRVGDVLVHPRFGACTVSQPGKEKVKVRRPTGGSFDLALAVFRFTRESDDTHGRRVFRLHLDT